MPRAEPGQTRVVIRRAAPVLNLPLEVSLRLASARAVVVAGPVPRELIVALNGLRGGAALVVTGEHRALAMLLAEQGAKGLGVEPEEGAAGVEALALKAPWKVDRLLAAGDAASSPAAKSLVVPGGFIARVTEHGLRVEEVENCG